MNTLFFYSFSFFCPFLQVLLSNIIFLVCCGFIHQTVGLSHLLTPPLKEGLDKEASMHESPFLNKLNTKGGGRIVHGQRYHVKSEKK